MITYATLTQLRQRLNVADGDTSDDDRLLAVLRQATAQIDRYTARRFAPAVHTRRYDYQDHYRLRLDIDLLALLTLTNSDGSAIDTEQVRLLPIGDGPKSTLLLEPDADTIFFEFTTVPGRTIEVHGVWGTHDTWSEAWRDSADTVQDNPLAADASTIAVADADGSDAAGLTPRFQVGQLLQIEDEYLHVTAVDGSADTLAVIRGVRGTSAVSHTQGTAIAVYDPPQDVQALCLRWATWLYQQVDAGIGVSADWLYPAHLPDDLHTLALSLRRLRAA